MKKKIKTALISVYYKDHLEEIVKKAELLGCFNNFHRRHQRIY